MLGCERHCNDRVKFMSPDDVIESTKYRAKCKTNASLAERLGMIRQTLAHKRKYPGTFTASEIMAMAKLLNWSDEEIATFIRGV